MFERRLRIFLALLFLGGLILAARAAQVQVGQRDEWAELAQRSAERMTYLTPERGKIVDVRGVVLAADVPAFEACVNYRAVPPEGPDAKWLEDEATRRAKKLDGWKGADKPARAKLIAQESDGVRRDLDALWALLARVSNQDRAAVDLVRQEVARDVEGKHNAYWQSRFRKATTDFEALPPPPWYERWISGQRVAPTPEKFQEEPIGEQLAFHPILGDVSQAVYNELKLAQDWLPQYRPSGNSSWRSILELRPTVRRSYPLGDVACHLIGTVGPVSREDREKDPNKDDPQRRYALIDRIGRDGLEKLAEQQLRGTRGSRKTDRAGSELAAEDSTPGETIRTTIDSALQRDIQQAFQSVDFIGPYNPADRANHNNETPLKLPMNGAAVVIDIETGEVRALVSVPGYDLNRFSEIYPQLIADNLAQPMRNRALMDAMEPGSTAKPIVGLAAVTQGLLRASDTVECTGTLPFSQSGKPRCWTMSMFGAHGYARHSQGAMPHPTGFLTLADALERSCNIYFETEGDKLGIEGLSYWMKQFGFGLETGIGLPERRGKVPTMVKIPADQRRSAAWYASIGQGPVNATPIQVANEMATIARDGIWVRPRLVPRASPVPLPTTRPDGSMIEDRRDLKLAPDALAAVHKGMFNVVNSPGGTGTRVRNQESGVEIAAKTGSATAAQLTRPRRDADGRLIYTAEGKVAKDYIPYGWRDAPNPEAPWYRMSGVNDDGTPKGTHSWVAGFAPAKNPKIAFAVYVEYGNSGGVAAGSVTKRLIEACARHGYVQSTTIPKLPEAELLRDEPTMTEEPTGAPEEPE